MQLPYGEDLYKAVLYAPIGICILNADTYVAEMVNDKFLEVAGKPYDAVFGRFYWDAFAEVRPYYEAALTNVAKTGEAFYANEIELMLIRHGQEEKIFVNFVYAPIKDDDGKVSKVAVWVLENTKQVKELQKTEAARTTFEYERDRFKSFFMQAPAGVCILRGPELVYELVNPAYQALLPGRKLLGRPILEALPELVGTPLQDILSDVYHNGKPYEMNELLVPIAEYEGGPTKDRYFSFSYQPWRDQYNKVDGILVIAFDVTGMINVQQQLQQAREQAEQQKRVYETITSGTPDLMYVWDLDYRFTYANSALLTMWGKTWDTAIGKGLRDNGYEEWHAAMHEREIDQVRATKQPVRGEVSFPHAVLGKRIYDYILIPVLNDDGEVEAVAGTTRDVTERKQMEETLAKTSEELQAINEEMAATNEEQAASNEELTATNNELALVNEQLLLARQKIDEREVALGLAISAANFGTWFIHSVTREFITDARLKELFGYYPEEDLSIEQALAQITEEYRGFVSAKLENAIYHGGDYDVTYPVVGLHDKRLRWLRAIGNLKADPSGDFSAFTGVVMDITEQHLAAQKIEQAEEALRMAIESGELAIWHLDETLGKIIASARFNELFGFAADEEVSFPAAIAQILPEYRQMVQNAVNASFSDAANFRVEYPLTGFHDGKQRWVRSVGKYVRDEKNGNYITGVMADITEQKMDEIRKNDFIGMVSHELKTPLTSLTLGIQMLEFKLKENEDPFVPSTLSKAGLQVKKMNGLINGFLNISRLESSKLQIVKQQFDLNQLVAETIEDTIVTTAVDNIRFENKEPVFVNADKDKISSVISNLLSNAVKYSPNGTLVEIRCWQENDQAFFSIKDEGLGIRSEDLDKIFERYYRVEDHGRKFISGFGIGLYLCSEIIQRHDGKISVESEFGKGSRFRFSIPLK
ncbi:PAS domain-containing protein [Taibaiella lutea]|uniref:histidine kinase n=1 Tax=Taibaiella lutea TaxID=2608001 RepID=A0A5M6CB46_9BACT|nr:PAS domain-containing protein [Taibaiella lutea]KAA5532231.1 PAS domain-containing protein [Taibaiella lutea]